MEVRPRLRVVAGDAVSVETIQREALEAVLHAAEDGISLLGDSDPSTRRYLAAVQATTAGLLSASSDLRSRHA